MATEGRLEQVVRRGWEAYARGDVDGTLEIFDPEITVVSPVNMANAGTYHGHDGFLAWISQWNEAWESFATELLGVQRIGERHVVTHVRQSGVGRGSGAEVAMETGWVFEIRDGLCVYLAIFPTVEEARALAAERER